MTWKVEQIVCRTPPYGYVVLPEQPESVPPTAAFHGPEAKERALQYCDFMNGAITPEDVRAFHVHRAFVGIQAIVRDTEAKLSGKGNPEDPLAGYTEVFSFHTHQYWVNKAPTHVEPEDLCIDAYGKILRNGKDFEEAKVLGRFPVRVMRKVEP